MNEYPFPHEKYAKNAPKILKIQYFQELRKNNGEVVMVSVCSVVMVAAEEKYNFPLFRKLRFCRGGAITPRYGDVQSANRSVSAPIFRWIQYPLLLLQSRDF